VTYEILIDFDNDYYVSNFETFHVVGSERQKDLIVEAIEKYTDLDCNARVFEARKMATIFVDDEEKAKQLIFSDDRFLEWIKLEYQESEKENKNCSRFTNKYHEEMFKCIMQELDRIVPGEKRMIVKKGGE